MRQLGRGQRVVLVVAFGVMCLATGTWVSLTYGSPQLTVGWTGYAPLRTGYGYGGSVLSPTAILLVWLGIACVWGVASAYLLRSSPREPPRREDPPGD